MKPPVRTGSETSNRDTVLNTLLNAFLTFESQDERWRAQIYGRNLTDKLYRQNVIRATSVIGTLDLWSAPRTYGLEVGFRY